MLDHCRMSKLDSRVRWDYVKATSHVGEGEGGVPVKVRGSLHGRIGLE